MARVSELLHLAPRSVRDLIYTGRLPSVRVGRLHYIKAADLDFERRRRLAAPLPVRAARAPRRSARLHRVASSPASSQTRVAAAADTGPESLDAQTALAQLESHRGPAASQLVNARIEAHRDTPTTPADAHADVAESGLALHADSAGSGLDSPADVARSGLDRYGEPAGSRVDSHGDAAVGWRGAAARRVVDAEPRRRRAAERAALFGRWAHQHGLSTPRMPATVQRVVGPFACEVCGRQVRGGRLVELTLAEPVNRHADRARATDRPRPVDEPQAAGETRAADERRGAEQPRVTERLCLACGRRALLAWADRRRREAAEARRLARSLGAPAADDAPEPAAPRAA